MTTMHDALLARLDQLRATHLQKRQWETLWERAEKPPVQRFPCPVCWVQLGGFGRVDVQENEGDMAAAFCGACKTTFKWRDED
jgi:hypothetical protein